MSLNLCDDGHEEICYLGSNCPLCAAIKDRDYFDDEVGRLEHLVSELETEVGVLKDKIVEIQERE